jgi:hydrogenase-4 membrane subunit HyfE
VSVSEFPAGELDVTTKLMEPSISFPVVVVRLEVPLSVSDTKQGAFVLLAGSVLKLNSVMFKLPLLLTVKSMIKPSTAPEASPLPPARVAPHKPLVTACALLVLVLVLPQPPTANSHANKASTANFFIAILEIESHLKIQRCTLARQWM